MLKEVNIRLSGTELNRYYDSQRKKLNQNNTYIKLLSFYPSLHSTFYINLAIMKHKNIF